jgi:hypothetical protein
MIYSDTFVWLHFPKCAGSKIESIFKKYFSEDKNIYQDVIDPIKDPWASWHDSIDARVKRDANFSWDNKIIITGFRKLPEWLLSRYSYEVQRSPHLNHDLKLLCDAKFFEQNGEISTPDNYASFYLPPKILSCGRLKYIRNEYFEKDFKNIFGKLIDLSKVPDSEYASYVNISKNNDKDYIASEIFKSIDNIYSCCPYWRMIEEIAYNK